MHASWHCRLRNSHCMHRDIGTCVIHITCNYEITCITNGFLNPSWFIVTHLICTSCNWCPCLCLVTWWNKIYSLIYPFNGIATLVYLTSHLFNPLYTYSIHYSALVAEIIRCCYNGIATQVCLTLYRSHPLYTYSIHHSALVAEIIRWCYNGIAT